MLCKVTAGDNFSSWYTCAFFPWASRWVYRRVSSIHLSSPSEPAAAYIHPLVNFCVSLLIPADKFLCHLVDSFYRSPPVSPYLPGSFSANQQVIGMKQFWSLPSGKLLYREGCVFLWQHIHPMTHESQWLSGRELLLSFFIHSLLIFPPHRGGSCFLQLVLLNTLEQYRPTEGMLNLKFSNSHFKKVKRNRWN